MALPPPGRVIHRVPSSVPSSTGGRSQAAAKKREMSVSVSVKLTKARGFPPGVLQPKRFIQTPPYKTEWLIVSRAGGIDKVLKEKPQRGIAPHKFFFIISVLSVFSVVNILHSGIQEGKPQRTVGSRTQRGK
jgi:hypothetical protein